MKYIQFSPNTYTVRVTNHPQRGGVNIRVARPGPRANPFNARIPIASYIYEDVLYPAVKAESRRLRTNVRYSLLPPDGWLIALGLVMWEGILHGFAWDSVKVLVNTALTTLKESRVAPASDSEEGIEMDARALGFCWTKYLNGKKQYDMFIGLKKVYERERREAQRRRPQFQRRRKPKFTK
jgi:hypothetical protein